MKTKFCSFLALYIVLSMCVTNVSAISRFVKITASGAADGSSWENASASIQSMITASASGDTVQIAAGKYLVAATIMGKDGVSLFGGYPADATTGSAIRDLSVNKTILDGQDARRVFSCAGDVNTTSKVTDIDGLIFQRGYSDSGSAIWMYFGTVLQNCIIRNNNSDATNGAAICVSGMKITGSANFATGALINCLIINNSSNASDGGAGGVYVFPSTYFTIMNCTFANNFCADALGAGGLNYYAASAVCTNNIFYKNSAPNANPDMFYQNIKGYKQSNAARSNWYDADAIPTVFSTNLSYCHTNAATPDFENPTNFNGFDATQTAQVDGSDWSLKSTSKLLNLGRTDAVDKPYYYLGQPNLAYASIATDLFGKARISGAKPDLGCYEYQDQTGILNVIDRGFVVVKGRTIHMLQPATSISVYNTVGAMVHTQKNVSAGTSIEMTRTGIYLVKVNTGGGFKTQKISLR